MPKRDLTEMGMWVDWPKVIARIRKAKTDDKAIEVLKYQLHLAVMIFEQQTATKSNRI